MTFPAAGGVWDVREPAHVCLCGRGPWAGCVGAYDAMGWEAKGARVLAGGRFLSERQQPCRLAEEEGDSGSSPDPA